MATWHVTDSTAYRTRTAQLEGGQLETVINSYEDIQHLIRVSCGHLEGNGANFVQRWKGTDECLHPWPSANMSYVKKNCKPNLTVITPPPNIPTAQVLQNLNTSAPLSGWP